jgi:multimeric flavodoxin WrbA
MRIMTILGSPRRQGNTARVLAWVEEQFRADEHGLDSVNVLDYKLQGCGECMACKRGAVELCSIHDDANGLFQRMTAADLVLLAAPVFCWGFPAQIKGLIDRLFCMMDFEGERAGVPRLHGKAMALLLTGGGEEANNADLVIRGFEQLVKWLNARMAGQWFVGGCSTPDAIGADVKSQATEFARTIAGKAH